tara:strand:- start:88 stop:441 length:354 start_codon:yes stop_codon:yes gene_type:complete
MYRFFRPWGYYEDHFEERREDDSKYKLKRLVVHANQKMSLQYHYNRSEHWVVVKGEGQVVIGEETIEAKPGMSFFIKPEQHHRIIAGKTGLTIIEVQMGKECEEKDIVRIEDDYDRI